MTDKVNSACWLEMDVKPTPSGNDVYIKSGEEEVYNRLLGKVDRHIFVYGTLVLKGNYGLSPKGKLLRNGLVCLQFVVSFILIIGALFVNLQNRQMLRMPLGFDKEQVVVVDHLTNKLQGQTGTDPAEAGRNTGCRVSLYGFAPDRNDG